MNVVTQFPATRDYDLDPRFQAMFEWAAIGIGICRLDGRILVANPALSQMLGYTRQELAGTDGLELCSELDREHHPQHETSPANPTPHQRRLRELLRGERDSIAVERRYRRKDGSGFWGNLTLSVACKGPSHAAFLIAMLLDATERKRTEERLRQAEKMEVVGRLTAGIAHDFNNLLTGVLLYCDLLTAGFAKSGFAKAGFAKAEFAEADFAESRQERDEMSQHVEEVRMAGEQGAALTHQLLSICRKQTVEPRPTAINEIVASTKNLLRRMVGERIELITVLDIVLDAALDKASALDSGARLVLADPAQLRQILLNLVLNARDAMPEGGEIGVITRATEFPNRVPSAVSTSLLDPSASGRARRAVSLRVNDNGCGMNAETRARLFEPFFTTKQPGVGTGLGLATVQRIVEELGGLIEVESEPGRGTSIEVILPAIDLRPGRSSA